jgi:nucleoside-diphosphate-sugar epimerase
MYRVLVIGGYGFFGSRLVQLLARQPNLNIVICGRSHAAAQTLVQSLLPGAQAKLEAEVADIDEPVFSKKCRLCGLTLSCTRQAPFRARTIAWRRLA